jgi:hypothetical protein
LIANRPSALIAQALVERQSAGQITARANEMGLPSAMTKVIVAACGCESTPTTSPATQH